VTATETSSDLFGHPRWLSVLFATETWERFSYFGNSALVVLYTVQHLLQPGQIEGVIGFAAFKAGLEFLFGTLAPQPLASQLFGFYTGLACSAPVIGGLVADRIRGERRTVIIGGCSWPLATS
jgi:proton-dependent oligopeptide transporter, POT family